MLLPTTARKTPDFNLLDNKDPQQVKLIYDALQQQSGDAQFMATEDHEAQFGALKAKVVGQAMPDTPNGPLLGWDSWTGEGVSDRAAHRDQEYVRSRALWQKRKQRLLAKRNDGHLPHVIFSDEISGKARKYVLRHQPDWVNLRAYKEKMRDTLGREWNLSTEFYHAIRPDFDIPHGYIVTPTLKMDGKHDDGDGADGDGGGGGDMHIKTTFGDESNDASGKDADVLQSVYKGNGNAMVTNEPTGRDFYARPEKFRI